MDELVNTYEMAQLEFVRDDWYVEKELYGVSKLNVAENWWRWMRYGGLNPTRL
jgi:hypothetical protein